MQLSNKKSNYSATKTHMKNEVKTQKIYQSYSFKPLTFLQNKPICKRVFWVYDKFMKSRQKWATADFRNDCGNVSYLGFR